MDRDAVCHPLYSEEDTLFCVENTISPPYGEGVCQNHAIRRAQTDGSRPQVKRYIILVICYYYTSTILTHYIPCTEKEHVIPLYREDDTLFCVENTISPPYGEDV